jgi:hypothetical protein
MLYVFLKAFKVCAKFVKALRGDVENIKHTLLLKLFVYHVN